MCLGTHLGTGVGVKVEKKFRFQITHLLFSPVSWDKNGKITITDSCRNVKKTTIFLLGPPTHRLQALVEPGNHFTFARLLWHRWGLVPVFGGRAQPIFTVLTS